MPKVFLNDNIVDMDKATVPVTDAGLLYGMGLFETMRACNGVVFALDDHLERLFTTARSLSINVTYTRKYIKEAVRKALEANGLAEARLRLTVTSGSASNQEQEPKPTLLIAATEFKPYPQEYYQKGIMVVLSPYKQNVSDPTCGHKTTSYMSRMLGLEFAHRNRAAEALWFTTDNRLAEGCISNVFIVKDSAIFTPLINTPVLPGIARKTVMQLAEQSAMRCSEKDLNINDLLDADEMFLTNVVMQVMPVTKVEKHDIGEGKVGPVAKELQKRFDDFVKRSCGAEDQDK